MGRHAVTPQSHDRSVNEPLVLLSPSQVLALYNQSHPEERERTINQKVKIWLKDSMLANGWKTVRFSGQQCLLSIL